MRGLLDGLEAEADIAGQDIPAAVAKLGRVTKELRALGQAELADQVQKKAGTFEVVGPRS